jgi:lipopolysaccharide/colanic/teichoic acid biosynthesis glycosyltransferase
VTIAGTFTRLLDVLLALVALLPAAPVCAIAGLGIWLTDGRPLLYRGHRVGLGGRIFIMYKLRTMRIVGGGASTGARITGNGDHRVFAFGAWLRRWKIDELPQFVNVLRGDMAIVGPRPEDPGIVEAFYSPLARETLAVRPGLASPGTLYYVTHDERQLDSATAESTYVGQLLPRKLALDLVYVREASVAYDLQLVFRAAVAIIGRGFGRRAFPDPPELSRARPIEGVLRGSSGKQQTHDSSRTHRRVAS